MSDLVIRVSEAGRYLKARVEQDAFLSSVWIEGEVGSVAIRGNTCYFKLKDEGAMLSCIAFQFGANPMRGLIEDGKQIQLRASPSFYAPAGRISIIAREAREVGVGEQQQRLVELGKKLAAAGCFEPARKRPLPKYPRTVAIVTSAEGKARHDFDKIAFERNPSVRRLLYPARVQGKDAPRTIAAAIDRASRNPEIDVIVVGRGGGDPSELDAFNAEEVVYAVIRSSVPVVSAVGHEADLSFCDLAADVRASTPSNAAELIVPEKTRILHEIGEQKRRIRDGLNQQLTNRKHALRQERAALRSQGIMWRLNAARSDVRMFRQRARSSVDNRLSQIRSQVAQADALAQQLRSEVDNLLSATRSEVAKCEALIRANDPSKLVARGYAIVLRNGQRISRAQDLRAGDRVQLMFADGTASATIEVAQENNQDE